MYFEGNSCCDDYLLQNTATTYHNDRSSIESPSSNLTSSPNFRPSPSELPVSEPYTDSDSKHGNTSHGTLVMSVAHSNNSKKQNAMTYTYGRSTWIRFRRARIQTHATARGRPARDAHGTGGTLDEHISVIRIVLSPPISILRIFPTVDRRG